MNGVFRMFSTAICPLAGLILVAATLAVPPAASAQGLTGALVGTVKDEQGGVLPGAVVRVTSPALIGGDMTTTTDERGQLRFPVLPPGSYTLTVDLAPRFKGYREERIMIGAGFTLERFPVLSIAGTTENVAVEADGSSLEARASGFESRFGLEVLQNIPTRRYSMFDMIRAAPGVSATSPSSGSINTVSSFGSGVNENQFLIDGTNFTCPCQGVSRAEPNVDSIYEVQVQSAGASVEYGNMQGAVFNVVTKQGGNFFQSDASYYGQPSAWTSQPIVRTIPGTGGRTSGYERERYQDFTTNVGGPVVRDRLWFFAGYQYQRDYDSQPGAMPENPRTYEQNKVSGKLTWRLSPTMQLMQSYHQEFWVNPTQATAVTPFEATFRHNASVPSMTLAHFTHAVAPNTFWEARVGRYAMDWNMDPATGDRSTPNRTDRITNVSSGNVTQFGQLLLDRVTAKAVLQHYRAGWLGADHQFRVGTSFERGDHRGPAVIPGGVRYVDSNGQPFQAVYREPSTEGGLFDTAALFASDTITIGDRITVNAGLRFDHNRAVSQDIPAIDANGQETGGVVPGLGTLYTENVFSPRLGLTAKLTSDGRTILRASYSRFHQGVLTGELSSIHPGVTPTTTMAYDAATGDYTRLVSVVDPHVNLAIDGETRTPRTDEYSIGLDREIRPRFVVAAAYIHKAGTDSIAWTDTGGEYREDTLTLADGRTLPVYVLTNSPGARRFLLTNPDGYFMNYHGMVLAANRRLTNGWQASGSYTYSRVTGLQPSSGGPADAAQLNTVAPSNTFGRDPNNLTNATGRLPNDRPHALRLMGSMTVPRVEIVLAGNLQHVSGKPWAATTQASLPQGDQRILLETRGSQRLPSQMLVDFRVSRRFQVHDGVSVDLMLDMLNLSNETAEEAIASDNAFASNFGVGTVFVDPRRVMISVRVNLGR
jgi:hypothetical protein